MSKRTWRVPGEIVLATTTALTAGEHEVFVIWTAALAGTGDRIDVQRCLVPRQEARTTMFGVLVHIDGAELARVQFENYDRGERSVVQLHTHPGDDVRMSDLDREWEVVCHVGALSIIVPDYGRHGLRDLVGVNVYEREDTDWRLWSPTEAKERLEFE